jgi:hypothetical protein
VTRHRLVLFTLALATLTMPVERDKMVLVYGGAANNVPADVVRAI